MSTATILPIADGAQVRRYIGDLIRRHPRALGSAVGLHALAAIAGLAAPRLLGDLVEAISAGTTVGVVDRLALAIVAFVVVQAVLTRFAHLASARLGERVLAQLREEFVDRVLSLPLATVERAGTGDLLTRSSRDVSALSQSVRFAIPKVLIAGVTICFVVVALLLVSPLLTLPFLVAVPGLFVDLEFAIIAGVLFSLIVYLHRTSHPLIIDVKPDPAPDSSAMAELRSGSCPTNITSAPRSSSRVSASTATTGGATGTMSFHPSSAYGPRSTM